MHLLAKPRPASATTSPRLRVTISLAGPVAPVMRGGIAFQLAADGARRALQQARDRRLCRSRHAVCGNEISFFLGELVIHHGCNPFLPDEVAASITAHPLAV